MKKLFKNYNYEFDKNEKKILTNFCKQSLKQLEGDERFFSDVRIFRSITEKINSNSESIKFTKDEKTRLIHHLKHNIDFLQKTIAKSWFIKKWLYKTVLTQYKSLIANHFND